jgi:hypothetical protein
MIDRSSLKGGYRINRKKIKKRTKRTKKTKRTNSKRTSRKRINSKRKKNRYSRKRGGMFKKFTQSFMKNTLPIKRLHSSTQTGRESLELQIVNINKEINNFIDSPEKYLKCIENLKKLRALYSKQLDSFIDPMNNKKIPISKLANNIDIMIDIHTFFSKFALGNWSQVARQHSPEDLRWIMFCRYLIQYDFTSTATLTSTAEKIDCDISPPKSLTYEDWKNLKEITSGRLLRFYLEESPNVINYNKILKLYFTEDDVSTLKISGFTKDKIKEFETKARINSTSSLSSGYGSGTSSPPSSSPSSPSLN